jgi:erythromycin esterase-like protein
VPPEQPEQAFARFPTWMWRNSDVLDFVDWLRTHNDARAERGEARAAFYGMDLYSLYASIGEVLDYLDEVDPEAARVARQRYGCLEPYQSDPAQYGLAAVTSRYAACEDAVVDNLRTLQQKRGEYLSGTGEAFLDAMQNARIAVNAERYYRAMYYGSAESWNLRDRHMFETLEALLTFHGPDSKAVIWAHNSHVGDARATEMSARGELNIGQLVRERFGAEAHSIGFGTDHGTVAAAHEWDGPMQVMRVRPSNEHSYERLCHDSGEPAFILPLRRGQVEAELRRDLGEARLERAIGVIYRPDSELLSHYFRAELPSQFDEYVWFDETSAVTPIGPTHAPQIGEGHPLATVDR